MSQRWLSLLTDRTTAQAIVVVGLILACEAFGRVVESPLVPPVTAVLAAWVDLILTGSFLPALGTSLLTLAMGFLLALVAGILLGIAMGRFALVERVLNPYINALMASPMAALIPIIMLIFGLQMPARVVVVFLFSFFVICINTLTGVKNADAALLEMARSFGATERQLFIKVALPGAVTVIFAGIRLGLGRGVGGLLVAEMLMALAGLGYQLAYYGGAFLTAYVYAILATVVVIALILTEGVQLLERRFTRWNRA